MDIFSHALWGFWIIRWRREAKWAALFGILPDILTFLPLAVYFSIIHPELRYGKPPLGFTPEYFFMIYNIMHSLVTWGIAFMTTWWFRGRQIFFPLYAWLLHIGMDIPSHSADYYPTKFLYPLTNFYINGISWGRWQILLPDAIALLAVYGWYFYQKSKQASSLKMNRTDHLLKGHNHLNNSF